MYLRDLEINTRTVNALAKKNIDTVDDLLRTIPRKYCDYREIVPLNEAVGKDVAIKGYVEHISKKTTNGRTVLEAFLIEESTGEQVHCRWFGQINMWQKLRQLALSDVVVCGTVTCHKPFGYCVLNPFDFQPANSFRKRIVPIYTKIRDFSEDMRVKLISEFLEKLEDPLEDVILQKSKLYSYKQAFEALHFPKDLESIDNAKKRLVFNDLLYFSMKLKGQSAQLKENSPFVVKDTTITDKFIASLPFSLTKDQKEVTDSIRDYMTQGKRVNYLVQGDVSCGKTIIAFISMFLMAENGYQSVVMAPTTVLAAQHFEKIEEFAKQFHMNAVFLNHDVKGKKKKEILADIEAGRIQFIVGTHSVISKDVIYNNLGLVITDEEHRFGVKQRDSLSEKAEAGAHVLSMSATPIPRSLASVIYGEDKEIHTVLTLPNGRKPIQTAVNSSDKIIYEFIEKQLKEGRQCYVVCPLITEAEEDSVCAGLESVEETVEKYKEYFEPLGRKIMSINGKMKTEEIDANLSAFKEKQADILISTTVIEVGVDTPNANVIVINNAERFGLSALHQLRGRVGRGQHQSYCILKSTDKENSRLKVMCNTTSGFIIAEEDLKLRGTGNLIGLKQSGANRYTELMFSYPNMHNAIKPYAEWIIKEGMGGKLIELYEEKEATD